MNLECRDQPVSFLRLERYLQGDVDVAERERVGDHLRQCQVCRACFEELQHEVVELLPLPDAVRNIPQHRPVFGVGRGVAHVLQIWPQLTAALAIAAALVLWARPRSSEVSSLPAARVAIKGGELALELVREHAGDPSHFAQGERIQVRVSCPPGQALHWDLVVFQAMHAYFPLTPNAPLTCANGVTLPGAFLLDGTTPADVCVIVTGEVALDRARLTDSSGLRALGGACVRISPAGTP